MQRMRRVAAGFTVALLFVGLLGVIPALAEVQDNPVFPSVDCGGEWHWVHNQLPDGVESGTLTVTFAGMDPIQVEGSRNGGVMHYFLIMPDGAALVSAEDDIVGGKLVLSHWPDCTGTTTTTEATTTTSREDETTSSSSASSSSSSSSSTSSTTPGETTTTTGDTGSSTVTSTPESTTTSAALATTTTAASGTGTLVVVKRTVPGGEPGEFTIVITAESGDRSWTVVLSDGESATIEDVEAGIYSITENLPVPTDTRQWTLESIVCDDDSTAESVGVSAGETVTCQVTNDLTEVAGTTVTTVPPVTATSLPFTGADLARITLVGMALFGLGALVLSTVSSRRRNVAA